MQKNIVISILVAGAMVAGAVVLRQQSKDGSLQLSDITPTQLSESTGKDGKNCWLAIDGIVYEIEQGFKWSEGEHIESSLAYCGADMSAVIDKAPHGRTKLTQLQKVGKLTE